MDRNDLIEKLKGLRESWFAENDPALEGTKYFLVSLCETLGLTPEETAYVVGKKICVQLSRVGVDVAVVSKIAERE